MYIDFVPYRADAWWLYGRSDHTMYVNVLVEACFEELLKGSVGFLELNLNAFEALFRASVGS